MRTDIFKKLHCSKENNPVGIGPKLDPFSPRRMWRVIVDDWVYSTGTVVVHCGTERTATPYVRASDGARAYCIETYHLVEIDSHGNTIRTYAKGDTLDGGTLIGGKDMDKKEAMKRLEAIEAETAKLKEIINKPESIVYDFYKLYGVTIKGCLCEYRHILIGLSSTGYSWYTLSNTEQTLNGKSYPTAKEALTYAEERADSTMFVFNNKKEALEYLMEIK